ncbi:MAG: hypothetical protein GKR93_10965 [Gammaproteobacteria bacterium]|nr:hypothetical protein [Gammaproteobacteria bacterium]
MKKLLLTIASLAVLHSYAVTGQEVEIQNPPPAPNREAARERFANLSPEEREQRRAERQTRNANLSDEERAQRRADREARRANMSDEERSAARERRQARRAQRQGGE